VGGFPPQSFRNSARLQHRSQDRIKIVQHIIIADAKDAIAGRLEVRLALAVVIRASDMAVPIELDDQPVLETNEVDDVGDRSDIAAAL